MIRGIIFLILSLTVLTLSKPTGSQQPCTCAEHAGPTVYEHAVDYLPSPALDYVDYREIPYDRYAQESKDFYDMVSEKDYVGSTTTPLLQGLLAGINLDLSGILGFLNDLQLLKLRVQVDIRGITGIIDGLICDLQGSLPLINGPIAAQSHVAKLLYMLNRKENLEQSLLDIDLHINLCLQLRELHLGKILCVEKLLGLSKILDGRLLGCSGGSGSKGGLLGGVLGGVVGGVVGTVIGDCNRPGLLTGLLATVDSVLDGVLGDLDLSLSLYLNLLGSNPIIPRIGLSSSELESYNAADDVIRNQMFDCYGQLENKGCPSYDQVKERIGTIILDDSLLARIFAVLRLQLGPGYQCTNPRFTCSLEDEIRCRFTGTLALNVDVDVSLLGLVDLDLDVCVGLNLHILEVLFLALTGSPHCNVVLTTLDEITGNVVIDLTVNEQVHDCMCETYSTVNLQNDTINSKVQTTVEEVKTQVASCQTADDYISNINEQETIIQEHRDSYGSAYDIQPTIETIQTKDRESCKTAQINMTKANDTVTSAQICKDRVVTCQQNEIDLWEARLENIKQSVIQADENVASCTKELYQAELDRVNHPGDQAYEEACARRHESLCSALEQACIIKEQHSLIAIELEARISEGRKSLIALEADLNLCLENLAAHVEIGIAQLRVDLNINLGPFVERLLSIFTSIRPLCTLLNPESLIVNLDDILDDTIHMTLQLTDVLGLHETEEDMCACHKNMILGTVSGLLKTADVIVSDVVGSLGLKRDATNTYSYDVFIGSKNTQKRDISGSQISIDNVPETTSSASSLSISFIMLFAIVSFVFFK